MLSQIELEIRDIALFLATQTNDTLNNVASGLAAIAYHDDMLEKLKQDFRHFSGGTEELHRCSAHMVHVDPYLPSTRALLVSPIGCGPDQAARFYVFGADDGTIRAAKRITDSGKLLQRQTITESWGLAAGLSGDVKNWQAAVYSALRQHLRQAPSHLDAAVNQIVRDTIDSSHPTLEAFLTAYLALGLEPKQTLLFALRNVRMPATHVIEPLTDNPS